MIGSASECFEGVLTLPRGEDDIQELPPPLLPDSRCAPVDGLCFSSLTHSKGSRVLSLGCWPSQSSESLAWYGAPECKNEVHKRLCLCLSTLCNKVLPQPRDDNNPELEETQVQYSEDKPKNHLQIN